MWLLRSIFLCNNTTFIESSWHNWNLNHINSEFCIDKCSTNSQHIRSKIWHQISWKMAVWEMCYNNFWPRNFESTLLKHCFYGYITDRMIIIKPLLNLNGPYYFPFFFLTQYAILLCVVFQLQLPVSVTLDFHWWGDNDLIIHPFSVVPGEMNTKYVK